MNNYIVSVAEEKDLDAIYQLYVDRVAWLKENKIKQWQVYLERHNKEEFLSLINNKTLYVLKDGEQILGAFELATSSLLWDDNAEAYYIKKLVVKIGYKGLGHFLIERAIEITRINNISLLRLNCLTRNTKLNKIYNKYGFKLIASKQAEGHNYFYNLRELNVKN